MQNRISISTSKLELLSRHTHFSFENCIPFPICFTPLTPPLSESWTFSLVSVCCHGYRFLFIFLCVFICSLELPRGQPQAWRLTVPFLDPSSTSPPEYSPQEEIQFGRNGLYPLWKTCFSATHAWGEIVYEWHESMLQIWNVILHYERKWNIPIGSGLTDSESLLLFSEKRKAFLLAFN